MSVGPQDQIRTDILRTTLKSVHKQLISKPEFTKVHRSYIVNLRFVSGNIKKNTLLLKHKDFEQEIVVSDRYLKHLRKVLSK